jgi:hypothetical protein
MHTLEFVHCTLVSCVSWQFCGMFRLLIWVWWFCVVIILQIPTADCSSKLSPVKFFRQLSFRQNKTQTKGDFDFNNLICMSCGSFLIVFNFCLAAFSITAQLIEFSNFVNLLFMENLFDLQNYPGSRPWWSRRVDTWFLPAAPSTLLPVIEPNPWTSEDRHALRSFHATSLWTPFPLTLLPWFPPQVKSIFLNATRLNGGLTDTRSTDWSHLHHPFWKIQPNWTPSTNIVKWTLWTELAMISLRA